MNGRTIRLFFVILIISIYNPGFSQEVIKGDRSLETVLDSLKKNGLIFRDIKERPEIVFSRKQAIEFLKNIFDARYWRDPNDQLRISLEQLIFESSHPPFDSADYRLRNYPYDSLAIPWDKFYKWEPVRLKIPALVRNVISQQEDTSQYVIFDIPDEATDSLGARSLKRLETAIHLKPIAGLKDTTIIVIKDTLEKATSTYSEFPFSYLEFPYQSDSIRAAVYSLLNSIEVRDSSIINFTGIGNNVTALWMNSRRDNVMRYWLKNELNDSVIIWIGNPSRDTIALFLEQGVTFKRPGRQENISDARINIQSFDNSKLLDVQKIVVKHQYWKFRSEASFVFSQSAISNWVKGGENSVASLMDITGYADYSNKSMRMSSNNFIRLKLGFLASGTNQIRKNVDLFETNSKVNHVAFGKFDFSAIMLFKTQVAVGKTFNKDGTSEKVSKFFNPAVLTLGFGLDYKPNKNTSINFSPLSYKGTFMIDTANYDQTKYGIQKGKKSKNEPGASFMISNKFKASENLTITNRLQLFTNYINKPQNIDIDWEMIVVASLNWFTDVRFNTHLIFDDDTKTPVLEGGLPVLNPDGSIKKTARIQFKEMLGLSLIFRF